MSLAVAAGIASLAVDVFPVVANDSIAYLSHSQDLAEYGFVNRGYRQFGYPLWLAIWGWLGSLVEPFALTSLAQRAALLTVVALAIWKARGSAFVLVGLLFVPTFVAYSNLLLTESLAIPLAGLAGVLVVMLFERAESQALDRRDDTWTVVAVATVAVALASIRFHYVLLAGLLVAVLIWAAWQQPRIRKVAVSSALVSTAVIGLFFVLMSIENHDEYGELFPSVRGERVQFWTLWQVVVKPDRELFRSELPGVFTDGNPYTFMHQIDALPYEEVKDGYAEATQLVLGVAGTTIWEERLKAAGGAVTGGRIDDLARFMEIIARDVLPGELEGRIHRNNFARENGVEGFNTEFNEGRVTRAGLVSSGPIPQAPMPSAADVFSWLVPLSIGILLVGLLVRESRWKAVSGLAVSAAYVGLAGWFILDNFRFLLPAYVMVVVLASSVAGELVSRVRSWRSD